MNNIKAEKVHQHLEEERRRSILPYRKRFLLLLTLDSIIVLVSISFSLLIFNIYPIELSTYKVIFTALILLISYHLLAIKFRLYHKAWEYASIGELKSIVKVTVLSTLIAVMFELVVSQAIPLRVLVVAWMMELLLIGGSRFAWRIFRDSYIGTIDKRKRTLIVGAGAAGTMVAKQLKNSKETDLKPIGYVDDDPNKWNIDIFDIPVLGKIDEIERIVQDHKVEWIVIAIPSLKKGELNRIVDLCSKTKIKVQIMPKLEDIMTGKVSVTNFRDVQVEDLLGREPVELDMKGITDKLKGKTVLVTGAGGSIGSEICRQVSKFRPKRLLLLGHGENSIYQINLELQNKYKDKFEIIPIIADIQDRERIFEVMEEYRPQVVYHAAAHKHVPLMEYNPKEAVKNNIFGTKNVAEAVGTYNANTFVLISTDKAVNPTNVMGATKRCAEIIVQELNQQYKTKYVAVRFGNVLGSRGSVIPLFKKQIRQGGPVTVTHPEMTRFFMTIPEASRLVIQAGALAKGGEIFVLDMGEPVKIVDLAKNLIKLSGFTEEEIPIKFTGIRPGEKLFEELLNEDEVHPEQIFPGIHIGKVQLTGQDKLHQLMEKYEEWTEKEVRDQLLMIANPNKDQVAKVHSVVN